MLNFGVIFKKISLQICDQFGRVKERKERKQKTKIEKRLGQGSWERVTAAPKKYPSRSIAGRSFYKDIHFNFERKILL